VLLEGLLVRELGPRGIDFNPIDSVPLTRLGLSTPTHCNISCTITAVMYIFLAVSHNLRVGSRYI
jgi:hypothetical protein